MAATIFKCNPVRFLVGDKSSLILFSIFELVFDSFLKDTYYKKKAQ